MRNAGLEEAQAGIKIAWRIPWTEEPGGLQSTGSQRVGHDWVTWPASWETCMQVRKQQLELDMEQQTGSK